MKKAHPKGPAGRTEVEQVGLSFRRRYLDFQYAFVQTFTEHLADLSRFFKGDLAEMLIFAVIGQMYLQKSIEEAEAPGTVPETFEKPLVSASRLADVTGIPRQTVRRKLAALERRGWIESQPGGTWALCFEDGQATARAELQALDDRAIDRVATLFRDLRKLVPRQ